MFAQVVGKHDRRMPGITPHCVFVQSSDDVYFTSAVVINFSLINIY